MDVGQRHHIPCLAGIRCHRSERRFSAALWRVLRDRTTWPRRAKFRSFRSSAMKLLRVGFLLLCTAACGELLQQAPAKSALIKNPVDADDRARRAGAKLYARECAACHGG